MITATTLSHKVNAAAMIMIMVTCKSGDEASKSRARFGFLLGVGPTELLLFKM
jgi:hypothetical protein